MRVLVTGASGFVGRAIVQRLATSPDVDVRAAVRRRVALAGMAEIVHAPTLGRDADWRHAVDQTDAVIHAAARVHVMHERGRDALAEFRSVNVAGTLGLARQAIEAGVRRFVFISSIKVNGESTEPGKPYTAGDVAVPQDAYGRSKLEAEEGLRELSARGMEVVIIRPVLVYGPGVGANFLAMMRWLYRGVPLPFGAVDNRRSLVAIDNLADLISRCLNHPRAAGQTFLVSDGEDLSTPELLRRAAAALGRSARLIPVPPALLTAAARATGRAELARRLCGSLQVDIRKTREMLGWSPPVSVDAELVLTAAHFLSSRSA